LERKSIGLSFDGPSEQSNATQTNQIQTKHNNFYTTTTTTTIITNKTETEVVFFWSLLPPAEHERGRGGIAAWGDCSLSKFPEAHSLL
jgi:hypothetical protein